jgi:hypothetical protein
MTEIATSLLLVGPAAVAHDADADGAHPNAFDQDSIIMTKSKIAHCARELLTSALAR